MVSIWDGSTRPIVGGGKNQTKRRRAMNRTFSNLGNASDDDLQGVVEPLASYICATNRPKDTLRRALAALLSEVNATNCAANMHVAVWSRLAGNGMNLAA